MQTFNLANTYVALDDACGARPLMITPDFWEALRTGRLGQFSRMVSFYTFDQNWTT